MKKFLTLLFVDLYSALIYISFLIISCALACQTELKNYNKIWLSLTYIFVVGFWATRYQIGFDYGGYMEIFRMVKDYDYNFVEPGYLYLNHAFKFTRYGYVYVIGITTALAYLFLFKIFVKQRILLYGLFFSLAFQFQFMLSNQMRQATVICLFLMAFHFIEEKKYWRYIIIMLIGMLIHFTSVFMILAIPMSKIRLSKWVALGAIFITYALLLGGLFRQLGTVLMQALPFYEHYQASEARMEAEVTGFSIVMLFWLFIAVYLILNRHHVNRPEMFNVYILGMICYIVFFEFHLLNRMMQYFTMLNIPLAALLCKNNFRQGGALIMTAFIAFILLSLKVPNLHGIHPYTNIFKERIERI